MEKKVVLKYKNLSIGEYTLKKILTVLSKQKVNINSINLDENLTLDQIKELNKND